MNELAQLVSTVGLPTALVIGVCLAAWKCGQYVTRRLFDEDKGIITHVASRHNAFLDDTAKHLDRQEALLTNLAALQADPKGPTSTIGTNEALVHLAEALQTIAQQQGVDISAHVDAIRRTLSRAK